MHHSWDAALCLVCDCAFPFFVQLIQLATTVVGALVVGFIKSWKLTLVCAAAVPVVASFGGLVAWAVHKQERDSKYLFEDFAVAMRLRTLEMLAFHPADLTVHDLPRSSCGDWISSSFIDVVLSVCFGIDVLFRPNCVHVSAC